MATALGATRRSTLRVNRPISAIFSALSRNHFTTATDSGFYDSTVEKWAQQPVEILSLKQMLSFGHDAWNDPVKILRSAHYVQRELPKRLARRLLDLQLLPHIVVTNPHIRSVYDNYRSLFESLRLLPPVSSLEENTAFCDSLRHQLDLHASLIDALATGLRECKSKEVVGAKLQLDEFFDSMLRSRISRRVIVEQHIFMTTMRPGFVGTICTDLVVYDAIEFAAQKARQVCTETYGLAPEVRVSGDVTATLPYIPGHLDYMLYELLKNAMRAVVEHHYAQRHAAYTTVLPPVLLRICAGQHDLTVRISDQGGGIPADQVEQVWSYGYTTIGISGRQAAGVAESSANSGDAMATMTTSTVGSNRFKMAGLGFGLGMSRLFARYFGGDLRLQVLPSYGVDAYLTLRQLDDRDWQEPPDEPAMVFSKGY